MTKEIPHEQWADFFDGFTRDHRGSIVLLEVMDADIGAQTEARKLPLAGISLDPKGSAGGAIDILLGTEPDGRLSHHIENALRVWSKQSSAEDEAVIEIETLDAAKVLLRCDAS